MRKPKYARSGKFKIFVCTFALIITTAGITIHKLSENNHKKYYKQRFDANVLKNFRQNYVVKINIKEENKNIVPNYNIDLDKQYQNLIYQLCEKNGLNYEFVLSIFYCESYNFKLGQIHKNRDGSRDEGAFQLNSRWTKQFKQFAIDYCDFPKGKYFNPLDTDSNIRGGIGYLVYLKNYWQDKGVSKNDINLFIANSYNQWVYNVQTYINKHGNLDMGYGWKVLRLKNILENTHTLNNVT